MRVRVLLCVILFLKGHPLLPLLFALVSVPIPSTSLLDAAGSSTGAVFYAALRGLQHSLRLPTPPSRQPPTLAFHLLEVHSSSPLDPQPSRSSAFLQRHERALVTQSL